jgi:hypothetical protein
MMKGGGQVVEVFFYVSATVSTIPESLASFTGEFKGQCLVLRCKEEPTLNGNLSSIHVKNIASIHPAFLYHAKRARYNTATGALMVPASEFVEGYEIKKALNLDDIRHTIKELELLDRTDAHEIIFAEIREKEEKEKREGRERGEEEEEERENPFTKAKKAKKALPPHIAEVKRQLDEREEAGKKEPFPTLDFVNQLFLTPFLERGSDLVRLPIVQRLIRYFGKKSAPIIRHFDWDELNSLNILLQKTPWRLVFREPLHTRYNHLKGLKEAEYSRILTRYNFVKECPKKEDIKKENIENEDFEKEKVKKKKVEEKVEEKRKEEQQIIPEHIYYGVRIFFRVKEQVKLAKHTIFHMPPLLTREVPMHLQTPALMKEIDTFLTTQAIVWLDLEHTKFALKEDHDDTKTVCQALFQYHQNASNIPPAIRIPCDKDGKILVPCIPPTLTADQTQVAEHILSNTVTIVEGFPGTGKTALITWAISHFENVLTVTLTGTMRSALRKRNGSHVESAYTINHITYHAHDMGASRWLAMFDVLIIDEFSNVGMRLFAKLLKVLPNIKRLILVGDHEQIRPIKQGDPLGDMRDFYPLFRLTEILRVSPRLVDLVMAPQLIVAPTEREDGCRQIKFSAAGPLTLLPKKWTEDGDEDYETTLKPILQVILRSNPSLMRHHIVVFQNYHRNAINRVCQKILESLGKFKKHHLQKKYRIGYNDLFVGAKITFTKNYNKPFSYYTGDVFTKMISDEVGNGELAVITNIHRFYEGYYLTITDCDDNPRNATIKHVIVSTLIKNAVDPAHIDLGYASTTTKIQGKEFERCIFWLNTDPSSFWTRSHLYVGISRAKEKMYVVGSLDDVATVGTQRDMHRRTCFRECLATQCEQFTKFVKKPTFFCLAVKAGIRGIENLKVMSQHDSCAPTHEQVLLAMKEEDDDDD